MDKYEYNLKLDQIKALSAEEGYMSAAEIADSINWNKIKIHSLKSAKSTRRPKDTRMQGTYF